MDNKIKETYECISFLEFYILSLEDTKCNSLVGTHVLSMFKRILKLLKNNLPKEEAQKGE